MHHAYTNMVGLGDSSTWRLPYLNHYVYMFLAPFLPRIATPLVAVAHWLPMFSWDNKPRRIHVMSQRALNLAQVPVLDWAFGHSIISCHVEQHLFPRLSDNMCLKVKPMVSQFLHEKQLPYEDSYLARFWLFLRRYKEFMVQAPPITELGGLQ
ncbi:hypothetical protein H8958_008358 [Nasalis larvatus]